MFECVKSFPIYISMAAEQSKGKRKEEVFWYSEASLRNFSCLFAPEKGEKRKQNTFSSLRSFFKLFLERQSKLWFTISIEDYMNGQLKPGEALSNRKSWFDPSAGRMFQDFHAF